MKIKDYFGEKIGRYFVFLGHYTEQAGVAAIIGVIVWLAACLTGGVNSPVIPFFCVVMSVWATVFLETWKRKQSRYAMEWGMVGIEEIEEERRLLYVAMTRAKNRLFVCYPQRYYFRGRRRSAAIRCRAPHAPRSTTAAAGARSSKGNLPWRS